MSNDRDHDLELSVKVSVRNGITSGELLLSRTACPKPVCKKISYNGETALVKRSIGALVEELAKQLKDDRFY
ncbi:hypothetical protein [Magnetovibrio blakemorei]|uniref:Uncharacterized protein n=1 Tax=Magnetovibrio blakemorei TaxID=28181 RepID=A0A1E5Q450_9PROT|nr:hypothetical protein [Magnetovibrio blakemorei]OEJ64658.1 hypothetical protein BEN30_00775 [Magnetovibrio blakemorei]